jgi:hypothetical protein
MCDGDVEAGLELAVGPPFPQTAAEAQEREAFIQHLTDFEPTPQELAQEEREESEREERVEESPVTTRSEAVSLLAHRWLDDHPESSLQQSDATLADALEITARDCFFIYVKLRRALGGRDDAAHGRGFDDHPIQNDWNGSAKVALISIVRSERAWNVIARATRDEDARHIAEELARLRLEVERAFPDVWRFMGPGFDLQDG